MELIGYWWVSEENKLTGTLKNVDNKFKLELLGSFDDDLELNMNKYDTIHGFTKCGKKVSLCNCICVGRNSTMPGIPGVVYQTYQIIIGSKYYNNLEDIQFKSLELEFDYLDAWIGKSGSTIETTSDRKKVTLNAQLLESINHKFEECDLDIIFSNNTKMNSLFTDFSWKQRSKIKLTFTNSTLYRDAFKYINDFEDFLSFNLGKNIECKCIEGIDINKDEIKVILVNTLEPIKTMERVDVWRSLISYIDIEDNFSKVYGEWMKNGVKLKPIINKMLLSEKEEKYFDIQLHFINIITALETFSRRFMNNCKIDEEYHMKRIESIMNSISNEDYKSWLKNRLKYSNEPTLKDRLSDIFNRTSFMVDVSKRKKNSIIFKIVNTRNYYTHFGEDKKISEMLTSKEAYFLYKYLKLCLKILILEILGVEVHKIIENPNKRNWCEEIQAISKFKKQFNIE